MIEREKERERESREQNRLAEVSLFKPLNHSLNKSTPLVTLTTSQSNCFVSFERPSIIRRKERLSKEEEKKKRNKKKKKKRKRKNKNKKREVEKGITLLK